MTHRTTLVAIGAFLAMTTLVAGQKSPLGTTQNSSRDYPQWRGPNRDGAAAAFVEPRSWPEMLTLKWKATVGDGYATPIVVGDRVYAYTREDPNEAVTAFDAETGRIVWHTTHPAPYTTNPGVRAHVPG